MQSTDSAPPTTTGAAIAAVRLLLPPLAVAAAAPRSTSSTSSVMHISGVVRCMHSSDTTCSHTRVALRRFYGAPADQKTFVNCYTQLPGAFAWQREKMIVQSNCQHHIAMHLAVFKQRSD
jgi:hypothetical protein